LDQREQSDNVSPALFSLFIRIPLAVPANGVTSRFTQEGSPVAECRGVESGGLVGAIAGAGGSVGAQNQDGDGTPKNHLPGIFGDCVHKQQALVKTVVAACARLKEY
jgi:hypothetical protein